ncbi:RagB/SusD family nutrient uptake outer membrane protein [Flavobacterium bizetiae]|uniref:RagB/SusD family nutrient uptake outer membrane protein n=1 Tax=Flavobacterium bizetiae TaxID=2704140 RepID=UPI0037565ADA
MKTIDKTKSPYWRARKIFLFSAVLCFCACDSFVEVDLPKSQLTSGTVFEDYTTANAALVDIYAKLRDNGLLSGTLFGLSAQLGCYTDELDLYDSSDKATFAFYTNAVLPSNGNVSLFWNNSYNQIYAANAVLEGLEGSTWNTPAKAQLKGEALFIRGLLHFYLLQLFGDIPYIKTTQYKANSTVSRMPEQEVYALVIDDLKAAHDLLAPSYASSERVRPNAFAVQALLARVYLYKGAWKDAQQMASAVIDNTALYRFENDLDLVFLKNSTEAIWQFMPSLAGKNTDEGTIFIFESGAPPLLALSSALVNSFDLNDLRKSHWIKTINNETGTWYCPYKYKESQSSGSSKEYSMVLRLSEQYLIRAEARAALEDLTGAREDLNKIRNRAGLSDTEASNKEALLQGIIEERKKELFTEYGHRFFDLKRKDLLSVALGTKPGWNTAMSLLPLPEAELSLNPNLKPQNPGY